MITPNVAIRSLVAPVAVTFAFSFFVNLLTLVLPFYTMQVFDRVLAARSVETLWALTAIAAFLVLAYGLLDAVRTRLMGGIDRWLDQTLFSEIVRTRLERAAEGRRDVQTSGINDLRTIRQFFSGQSLVAVLDTIWSPLFILVGFLIHPLLGLVGVVGAVGLSALSIATEVVLRAPQKLSNLLLAKTNQETESAARSAEVISALGMAPAVLERIRGSATQALEHAEIASRRSAVISGAAKVFRFFIQIAILAVGVSLVLTEHLTAGAVFAAMMIMGRGLAPFEQMQRTWATVVSARQSYGQLQDFLGELRAPESSLRFPAPRGALSVENVFFASRPGEKPILQGVSFALAPGEALGIIGPSAAGKSTLARLLIGVWRPTAGKIRLDGIDVTAWNRADFGPHIGYVPQDVELLPGTVRDNIARFTDAPDDAIIAAARAANAHDLIVRLPTGYDTQVGESGALLSGGQRQRIALARALFGDPRYLVLDEPNSNLDSEGEAAMLAALERARERGATIIMVAHRPSLLVFVDKLLLLKEGRVELFGDRQTVLARLQPRPTVVPTASAPLELAIDKARG